MLLDIHKKMYDTPKCKYKIFSTHFSVKHNKKKNLQQNIIKYRQHNIYYTLFEHTSYIIIIILNSKTLFLYTFFSNNLKLYKNSTETFGGRLFFAVK